MVSPPPPTTPPPDPRLVRRLEATEMAMHESFTRAAPRELARERGIEALRTGGLLRLTAAGFDHPFFNRVMGVGTERPAEAEVEALVAHYREVGVRRWMMQVLPAAETQAFRAACREHGLVKLRGWAKHLAPASLEVEAGTELRLERIAGGSAPAREDAWAKIVVETFKMDPAVVGWLRGLAADPAWHLYLALDGDRPVATAALWASGAGSEPRVGELDFAGTLESHRGRGAQSALVARRFRDAREMGLEWIATETDEPPEGRTNPSRENLVRLGLPVLHVRSNWGPPKP